MGIQTGANVGQNVKFALSELELNGQETNPTHPERGKLSSVTHGYHGICRCVHFSKQPIFVYHPRNIGRRFLRFRTYSTGRYGHLVAVMPHSLFPCWSLSAGFSFAESLERSNDLERIPADLHMHRFSAMLRPCVELR